MVSPIMFSAISGYLWRERLGKVNGPLVTVEESSEGDDDDDWVMIKKIGPAPGNLADPCYTFTELEAALESELNEAEVAAQDEGNPNKEVIETEVKLVNARKARVGDFFSTPGSSIVKGRRIPGSKSYSKKAVERTNKSLAVLGSKQKNNRNHFQIKIPQQKKSSKK